MKPVDVIIEKKKRRKRKKGRFDGKPVFEPSQLGKNPFVNKGFLIPYVNMKTKAIVPKVKADGSTEYEKYAPEIEYLQFVKVFLLPTLKQDVLELSLRAKEMLWYIVYNLEQTKDYVALDRKAYMELHKIKTEPTYLSATKELRKLNFIAETGEVKDVYWINPYYFFYGSRLNKFPDNKILLREMMDDQDKEDQLNNE